MKNVCVALRVSVDGSFESLDAFKAHVIKECKCPEEVGDSYLCGELEEGGYFLDVVIEGAIPPDGLVELGPNQVGPIEDQVEEDFTFIFLQSLIESSVVVYFK